MWRRWPIGPYLLVCLSSSTIASARAPSDDASTHADEDQSYLLRVRSDTYLGLFQRALLPGPGGSIVRVDTVIPVYEYWSLQAKRIDAPWADDGTDLEVAGWGNLTFGTPTADRHYDGDVTSAWVQQRLGATRLKLGRQAIAGGAARYARFDGVMFEAAAAQAFSLDAYAGFTVLPRWDARPGYAHLGSAADSLAYDTSALGDPQRSGYWISGARASVQPTPELRLGASFHEQREQTELSHRNLGVEARVEPSEQLQLTADGVLDLDSRRLADARARADFEPTERWIFAAEYLHAEPSLFLSRQSVLSVFSSEAFDELGVEASYRPFRHLQIAGAAYTEWLPEDELGSRVEASVSADVDRARRLKVRAEYARVLSVDNGYHALRNSLRYRLSADWTGTAEAYFYAYDAAISNHLSSEVYAGNLEWKPSRALALLWGASLSRSPYASSDAQTLLRLRYEFVNAESSYRRALPTSETAR